MPQAGNAVPLPFQRAGHRRWHTSSYTLNFERSKRLGTYRNKLESRHDIILRLFDSNFSRRDTRVSREFLRRITISAKFNRLHIVNLY